jgi:hypothetical protein
MVAKILSALPCHYGEDLDKVPNRSQVSSNCTVYDLVSSAPLNAASAAEALSFGNRT